MTTPKVYLNSIKAGVVTREILGDVCYSYNKRAKNYRDRESYYRNRHRNYHHTSDKYNNEENARDKKEEFYDKKGLILSMITPSCIHEVSNRRINVCEEEDFEETPDVKIIERFIRFDKELREYINLIKYSYIEKKYFLFYELGSHSFHTPIDSKINGLPVIHLDSLTTYGEDIIDLLPVQFCDKVLNGLKTGKLKLID